MEKRNKEEESEGDDVELIEWPSDTSRFKREKRFETRRDCQRYRNWHLRKYIAEDKRLQDIRHDPKYQWKRLLYSKGYAVPFKWLKKGTSLEPNRYDSLYEERKNNIKKRWEIRRRMKKELERWEVKIKFNPICAMPNRLILDMSKCEKAEYYQGVLIRWLSEMVSIYEIYQYKCLHSNVGYKYYSNEQVIIMYIEKQMNESEDEEQVEVGIEKKRLYRIRQLLRKDMIWNREEEYKLRDKWIVVIDMTGRVTCEGYNEIEVNDEMSGKEFIHVIKHYNEEKKPVEIELTTKEEGQEEMSEETESETSTATEVEIP